MRLGIIPARNSVLPDEEVQINKFMSDYGKQSIFRVKQEYPYNGEPPLSVLGQSSVTPTSLFFSRNHGNIPEIDLSSYQLSITGLVDRPLIFSLDDLHKWFTEHTVLATLECAGNRRLELANFKPITGEVLWEMGAISTAEWTGILLQDVLDQVRVQNNARHIEFIGLDEIDMEGKTIHFGGSIPIHQAACMNVLLAYKMNGVTLNAAHGFPLRAIVPGYIGARSVKWLSEIRLLEQPSPNYYYSRAYRMAPPQTTSKDGNQSTGIPLGELKINSIICYPEHGERLAANPVRMNGYAIAGGGHRVERVDLSTDGGETWIETHLGHDKGPWAWRFWETELALPPGRSEIISRAWDSAANTQPAETKQLWNAKGYMNNAWHRVIVDMDL